MKSSLDDYLNPRDYQGALALLDFSNKKDKELWKAYCFFHNGDFEGARKVYENLIHSSTTTHGIRKDSLQCQDVCLYLACCDFHLKRYDDARTSIAEYRGESPLKSRLVLLLKKKGFTMDSHDIEQPNRVGGGSDEYVPSEMFKAAMLYADCNFQEAAETYKNILRLHPEFLALHVFVAMCYFKMVSRYNWYNLNELLKDKSKIVVDYSWFLELFGRCFGDTCCIRTSKSIT